jgi:hypothetical protein
VSDPETLIYPDVLASTKSGPMDDGWGGKEKRHFAEAVTNNQDTVVRTIVYWHTPEGEEPVLMIEIDDEEATGWSNDFMDITVRIRRNDGLIYEGNRATQEGVAQQLDRLEFGGGQPQIQIRNPEASTNWINITSEQQLAIEKILKEEA